MANHASYSNFLPYAFFDGKIVPFEEAKVSVATLALQYGISVFGGVRGYLGQDQKTINIFRLRDHMTRLSRSASLLKIAMPADIDGLSQLMVDLTRKNSPTRDVYYRPFAYKSDLSLGPSLDHPGAGFSIYMLPLGNYFGAQETLKLMVSSWVRVTDNSIPARGKIGGAYINSSIAKDEAVINGYDDALMLNAHGKIGEASAANMFMVRDGVLITTPVTADILEGITRRTVLQLAKDLGIPTQEREIDRSEIYLCDELFLCGTGAQISPVGSVDQRPIGDPKRPLTGKLQTLFFEVVRGNRPEYRGWLTPVEIAVTV